LRSFPSASELGIWTQGDVIVLKRLKPIPPSLIAERMPEETLPLEEIAAEVYQLRAEKRFKVGKTP